MWRKKAEIEGRWEEKTRGEWENGYESQESVAKIKQLQESYWLKKCARRLCRDFEGDR